MLLKDLYSSIYKYTFAEQRCKWSGRVAAAGSHIPDTKIKFFIYFLSIFDRLNFELIFSVVYLYEKYDLIFEIKIK